MYDLLTQRVTIKKRTFTISNNMLENTNEYKYLGSTINKTGNLSPTLEDLSCINSKISL